MKKNIITTTITLSIAVLLVNSGVLNALVMFLLMGQIPGTSYSIPASAMLALLSATTLLIAASIVAAKMQHTTTIRRLIKKHLAHKARMPRRRFGQI
jgi:inner membrane protein involved in colicin E2 resistance